MVVVIEIYALELCGRCVGPAALGGAVWLKTPGGSLPLVGSFWLLSCPWFGPQRCQLGGAAGGCGEPLSCPWHGHWIPWVGQVCGAAVTVVQLLFVQAALGPLANPL